MESLINNTAHEENNSEASNSSIWSDKQSFEKNNAEDKIVIDSYILMDSLNNYVYEENNFTTEDSSVSTSSDEYVLSKNELEDKTCSVNLSTSVHDDTNFQTVESYDYTTSEKQALVMNESQREVFTSDYLSVESLLNNDAHTTKVASAFTRSSKLQSVMGKLEQNIPEADCLSVKSLNNDAHEDNLKIEDTNILTESEKQAFVINNFENQISAANYLPTESLLKDYTVKDNFVTDSYNSKYEEKIPFDCDYRDKMPLNKFYLPIEPSFDNYVHKNVFKSDAGSSSTRCEEQPLVKNDFDDNILLTDYNSSTEAPSNNCANIDNNFEFDDQQSLLDPFSIIMHGRNEINVLSEKCIAKILLQKEKISEQYGSQFVKVTKQCLKNLSLQQTQFESIISDTKVQLSSAYISNHRDIVKSSKSIVKNFEQHCRLFEHFFPSFAFKNEVLSSLEDNQVVIISADSYYSFNAVLPIFIKHKYPERLLVCCESCEFTRSCLYKSLFDLLGSKVITDMNHKSIKNRVVCFTEEDMLECFSDKQHIFQQEICIVISIPLIRTVTCDILLASLKDMLKVNKDSKLILLIPSFAEIPDYKKYFSKSTFASILKTKCLRFPITTICKNNDLSPEDDYIEEVVRTVLAILLLKEVGDILVFLPHFEDLEYTAEMVNLKLLQPQDNNLELILIHENASSNIHSLTKSASSTRRIFLATNCAEALYLPSVQHVVDCGIKNIYIYDNVVKTDLLKTTFISCKNANLRKNMAGAQQPGTYYQIYSKNNYQKDMPRKDLPEILVTSPLNTMMKIFQYRPYNPANTTFMESFSEEIKLDTLKTLRVCGVIENNCLTSLGENIAKLPFDPNYSKLILLALEKSLAFEAIVLVSFFTSNDDIFLYSNDRNQQRMIDATKLQLTQNDSDTMSYLYIYKICMENHFSKEFCDNHCINHEVMLSISSNVMDLLSIVNCCLEVNVPHKFSAEAETFACVTELLFQCFQFNLCVFSGHIGSGYKLLQSSKFAYIHSSSLIYQWEILPQFIIYDHLHSISKGLVHITAICDDIIMTALSNGILKYKFEDLFEQILLKRTIEPIGEELMNVMTKGGNNESFKIIESQVRMECGNNFIFLDLNIKKGAVHIYALPNYIDNALCVVDDIIKNMLDDILNENRMEVLELKRGKNKVYIKVSWWKGAIASSLAVSNQPLHSYESKQENNANDHTKESTGFPYYLCFSWMRRYCIGEGYVTFGNESFLEVRKLALRNVKMLNTEVFVQLSDKDKFQLLITGLPPNTCHKNLKKELHLLLPNAKIDTIELKCKNPFETPDEDVEKFRALITMKCIEYNFLDKCDIVIPKPDAKDLDMMAYIYTYNNEILDFVADVLSTEFSENKETITNVRFNVHVSCSPDIFKALKPCFNSEMEQLEFVLKRETGNRTDLDFSFHIDDETEDKVLLKLSSNNNELLQLLHRTINNLLEGEILSTSSVKGLENLFFYGGHLWLRNLEETENIYILEDNHKKEIRLYGSQDSCYNAKLQIISFLEDAENDVMLPIPLCNKQNSSLLLKAIIKEYGVNLETLVKSCALRSALLDIKARQLLLRGSRDAVTQAENAIMSLSEGLEMTNIISGQSQEICPVCSCPASNLAFRLEHCGHLYCLECIQALIEQAQFPICCCAEKCSKDIVLKDIKKVLKNDEDKIKTLAEKSMKEYLESNRTEIAFCPVADCSMFFYKSEVSRNKANCPLCKNDICISCNVLYHGGYTCEMYQNSKTDPDYSFKVWQKTNSKCKQCPRCNTAIEKIAGCNRMFCTSCKGRFCWICIKEFPTDQAVYNHIHSNHTGMLFA